MFWSFWSINLILIVTYLIYKYFTWYVDYWNERGVPGPKPKFFYGNFKNSILQKENIVVEVNRIYKEYRHSTPYVGVFSGKQPNLLIIDPQYAKDVLIRDFKCFHDNKFSEMVNQEKDKIFARNPFTLKGEEWKDKRTEIAPAFSNNRLKAMYPIIEDVCSQLTKYIRSELGKDLNAPLDGREVSARFTCEAVSNCIYGIDSKSFTSEENIMRKMGSSFFDDSPKMLIYMFMVELFPIITKFYQMQIVPKEVERFFAQILSDTIKMRKEQNIQRDDFINFLLESNKKKEISHIEMAADTVTFFLDGFETSSHVIALTLFHLSKDRDSQQKLRDEIRRTINIDNGKISFDQLTDMKFLDQVFNESLRIIPPGNLLKREGETTRGNGGLLFRICTEEKTLIDYNNKELVVEKGMPVLIPIYSIHLDPDNYESPDEFKPERFSEENGGVKKYKEKGVFLPFGIGPRTCLGMKFGIMQSKAAIVEIIRNFDVKVNEKTKEPFDLDPNKFILTPQGSVWFNFEAINL